MSDVVDTRRIATRYRAPVKANQSRYLHRYEYIGPTARSSDPALCVHGATLFDLQRLFRAVDAQRERHGLSWAALARQVGVAASTIRRFGEAEDAEADGVLALVIWLGAAPEDYVRGDR